MRPAAYVAARIVSLSLLTFASSLIVVAVATRGGFHPPRLLVALALCSAVAVLIGLSCVARAASLNHLVVMLLWVTTLLYLPLLGHFGLLSGGWTALLAPIPSWAMLVGLTASVDPAAVDIGVQIGAALYLAVWVFLGWRWTLRGFERALITEGR